MGRCLMGKRRGKEDVRVCVSGGGFSGQSWMEGRRPPAEAMAGHQDGGPA